MNAELSKIRKNKGLEENVNGNITKINPDNLLERIVNLNTNMSSLYSINHNPNAKIEDYIEKIINNIYLILDMFNDMGIYPDYFYDVIVKINIEYRNLVSDGKIRGNYSLYHVAGFPFKISKMIETGLSNRKYQINLTENKDISECFVEMVSFFQKYNLPYNVKTLEMCQQMFGDIYYNINNIINNTLNNSDYISDDIECLSRLLFEYISFFVAIGVNPKPYLDEYIEKQSELGKSK